MYELALLKLTQQNLEIWDGVDRVIAKICEVLSVLIDSEQRSIVLRTNLVKTLTIPLNFFFRSFKKIGNQLFNSSIIDIEVVGLPNYFSGAN